MNEVGMRPFLDNWILKLKHILRDMLKISLALSMEKNYVDSKSFNVENTSFILSCVWSYPNHLFVKRKQIHVLLLENVLCQKK